MTTRAFEVVLDECIDDVRSGRRTLDQCLEANPEHAAELELLLRMAAATSTLTMPSVLPDPVARARFIAQLTRTPQEPSRVGSSLRSFELVLDECSEAVRAGRSTVEECLAKWPSHAARLEPLLRTASLTSALALPDPARDPASRARFMAEVARTPQQPRGISGWLPAFRVPSLMLRAGAMAGAAAAVAFLALVLTLSSSGVGGGATVAEASTLTVFAGAVERAEGDAWVPLADGSELAEGTRLRTDPAGRALLTFVNGTTVALEPSSDLTIERSRLNGTREIALRQWSGRLWHQVSPDARGGLTFKVTTADAVVIAHGTVFETSIEDGETAVSTAEGQVEVVAGAQRVFVAPGETAAAKQNIVQPKNIQAAPRENTEVKVDAPFVASLIGPDGRATGALPTGLSYQQIPGALSTDVAGLQKILLGNVPPGEYTLVLRRVAPGEGSITLGSGEEQRVVELSDSADTVSVLLQVAASKTKTQVAAVGEVTAVNAATAATVERVVITDETRKRVEETKKRQEEAKKNSTPTPTPTRTRQTATPTRTPTPSRNTPTATQQPVRPTATPPAIPAVVVPAAVSTVVQTATATATSAPTSTPVPANAPTATPTGTPVPTATPTATVRPTGTPSTTPTATPSRTPTATPKATSTPTSTATPKVTPTPARTATPKTTVAPTAPPKATPPPAPTPAPRRIIVPPRQFR